MDIKQIETQRFVLTKMTAADGDKYFRLSNNPNVMKYVTGYSLSRSESDEMLRGFLSEYGNDTYLGRYLIEEKVKGTLIGTAKLDKIGSEIEIGYRVLEEQWGKGIATEIASTLIEFAITKLGAGTVIAFVNVSNSASVRVLEKAGMTNIEMIEDPDEVKYKFSYSRKTNQSMKKVLYTIIALITVVLVAAFIMPKDYAVKREIIINKPKAQVFEYLKMLKNQDNWSVWMSKDPNIKKNFKGTDGTVGYTAMWEGNKDVGKGEQEITEIIDGERINTQLRFIEPFESKNNAYMTTASVGPSSTRVGWGFSGRMPIPMNVMLPFMGMEESVGKDFQDGLNNLKAILEK